MKTTDVLDKRSFLIDVTGTKIMDASGNLVLENNGKYFLYGQEVDDFHYLDKSYVYTVVTAAVQDIDRIQQESLTQIQSQAGQLQADALKINELQNIVTTLKTENASLKSTVASHQSLIASQQSQITALENKLSSMIAILGLQIE